MSEKASGLRFDIYERIHLPDQFVGIERLDEIELTPHMELQVDSGHAVLKGHLQLSGTYVGTEQTDERQTLSHRIPVEISMPEERLIRDAELGVDIENFDVDLLSTRTINVTGVLSLKGLESVSTAGRPNWQDETEMVFVQPPPVYPNVEQEEERHLDEVSEVESTPIKEEASSREGISDEQLQESLETELTELIEQNEENEENEVKVAFASQPAADPIEENHKQTSQSEAVNDVVKASGEERSEDDEAENEEAEREAEPPKAVEAEWKNLFLGQEETQQFQKVRMCIVQKEETLESIAERYELNPREIILYNRMSDQQEIEAGQVLYIPR